MLGQYKCLNVSHNDMQIEAVCQNKQCKQPSRRICFQCITDHQQNDQNFDRSDLKSEQKIQQMINEFRYYNVDRMNNIALQCYIQQYLLSIEMIEYVKLWNYKYNKIKSMKFLISCSNSIIIMEIDNLLDYLNNDIKNISIIEYLQQYQQKLLYIDDLKDIYIKDIIREQNYNDITADTEQNKLSIDTVQSINEYKNQLVSNITQNDLFKQKHQQNEEFIITICELMLQQGYDLKTDALYDKFRILQDVLLDNSIENYKFFYIQSKLRRCIIRLNIAHKQQTDESQLALGLSLINQSLDIQGNHSKSFRIQGIIYDKDNKFEESTKMFEEAIKIDPKFVIAYNNKGNSLNSLQKYEQAIDMIDRAIQIDPKLIKAYNGKGNSLNNLQKYEQAIEMFDQAIKIDPNGVNSYNGKGYSLYNLQKYQSAIDMFDQAIKINPKYVNAYNGKGNSLNNLQKYEQAIDIFDQAIKIDPKYVNAYNGKGYSLNNLQKYEQAIDMFDQAIKIDPRFIDAYYYKDLLLFELKDYKQSKEILQKGLQLQSNHDGMKLLIKKCDQQLQRYRFPWFFQ